MLRFLPLIVLAMLVAAQGPPRELFCVAAGEIGLAGESPNIMFTVFERGSWRPAEAYIEPENVTFVLVPAVARSNTDPAAAVTRGALPPPVLRNDTVVCFEAAPGRPAAEPPAPGLLIAVERRGAVYHVYVSRAGDVDNPANYTLAQPGKPEGKRPDGVELVDRRPAAGGRGKTQPEAGIQYVSTLSYWAAFKLYRLTAQSLQPGACVSTVFDVPDGTSQAAVVLTGGTTPGTYSYLILNSWNPSQRWSGTVSVLPGRPQTAVAWLPAGRAQYTVQICNQNSQPAAIYASALVSATNSQYLRNDVIRTPSLGIYFTDMYYCQTFRICPVTHVVDPARGYFVVPGFYIDAASDIYIQVYVKVPKMSAIYSQAYIYMGGVYIGSVPGYDSGNFRIYSGVVTVPSSLLMYLLPTYGSGGALSIGPFTFYLNTPYDLEVKMGVRRPQELAPAGDSKIYTTVVRRFRESFLFLDKRSFIVDLDYMQSGTVPGYFVISTKPITEIGTSPWAKGAYVSFYVRFFDSYMNPIEVNGGAATSVNTTSWWGSVLSNIPFVSVVLQIYDLVKSTIDALKKTGASFPIIGYVTFAMDALVNAAQARIDVVKVDDKTLKITLYTGSYDRDPLEARIYFSLRNAPAYVAVTRIDYLPIEPYASWITVFSVDYPVLPYTSVGATGGGGGAVYFPYRTLTCGVQESGNYPWDRCDRAYYR
ncbi:hypothetical protein [Pyrobaculum ferrireducens]|uniref:hypothetical protein n=1 Tax=Pyrobaculum ferrireducens TaxID=1104324 RepID=UPI000AF9D039|nr:hypothetical protein [Pyrobaculum ferrireducens]